jgi:hypothetical protein
MHVYPHDAAGRVTETWEASKWLWDAPSYVLTPMFRKHDKQYFVNELVACTNGEWFIPERIFTRTQSQCNHQLQFWCRGHEVFQTMVCMQ